MSTRTLASRPLSAFASCLPGLEGTLASELSTLKIANKQTEGGVEFLASPSDLLRCHLELGTASHVYLRLGEFRARKWCELRRKLEKVDWGLIDAEELDVKVSSKKSRLNHTVAIGERVREVVPPGGEGLAKLLVRVVHDVFTVSLDTSQTPLHRRGYRLDGAKAPLREDLAFAMLRSTRWSKLKNTPLLDPFCGSGTIAIEAAMMMAGLPPGRLRDPPLGGTHLHDPRKWNALLGDAQRGHDEFPTIRASDRDAGAVRAATANATRAEVHDLIGFRCCAFTDAITSEAERVAIVTNPPFGGRVALKGPHLYQKLGSLARDADAEVAVLVKNVRSGRTVGNNVAFSTRCGGLSVACLNNHETSKTKS